VLLVLSVLLLVHRIGRRGRGAEGCITGKEPHLESCG